MLIIVFGALVLFVALIVAVAVGVGRLVNAKGESDRVELAVSSGDTSTLLDWNPNLVGLLSRDVAGVSYYFRPMGGARTSKVVAAIPSWQGAGRLLLLSAESTPERGEEKLQVLARGVRIGMLLDARVWQVYVDGAFFGSIDPNGRALYDGRRVPVGHYQRSHNGTHVFLRGVEVALLANDPSIQEKLPPALRPLFRLAAPPDAESSVWLLALGAMTLSSSLFVGSGAPLLGVP